VSSSNRGVWVYDIESFANFFSCIFLNIDTEEKREYIVCKWRDDLTEFIEFVLNKELVKGMIGFNNLSYDFPIIFNIITKPFQFRNKTGEEKARIIKGVSNNIVNQEYSDINPKLVQVQQLDLYRVMHFDNKFCSLKQCEFVMRWNNLMDLPYHHEHEVKEDEIPGIMEYNFNDVLATYKLYKDNLGKVELRKKLTNTFGINLINANDPKIGSEIFAKFICESKGISWNELKDMRTYRDSIKLSECIFDYVKFESKEFNDLLQFFKGKTITETKGVFKDLVVKYKGLSYVYGLGGLHCSCEPGIYNENDEYVIYDIDVESYYPNLFIQNRVYPEHLGEVFCDIYTNIIKDRVKAKQTGDKITDAGLKLAANGSFGKSKDEHSYLYDPKAFMKITINGQLLLSMLIEQLTKVSSILQCNTDGVTIRIKKSNVEQMFSMIKEWEGLTKLKMEYVMYKTMVIRDVNNYLCIKSDGSVKHKGTFEIDKEMKGEVQYYKDHSNRIVPLAVSLYFTDGIPVDKTIREHLNGQDYYSGKVKNYGIFDFCAMTKAKGGKKGVPTITARYVNDKGIIQEEKLQKINRYFIANKGVQLLKIYPNKSEEQVVAHPQKGRSYKAHIFNKIEDVEYNLDYTYYIREANKIINSIVDFNYSLF
jgi:hypothetical protein